MKTVRYTFEGEEREASIDRSNGSATVRRGKTQQELLIESSTADELIISIDGRRSVVPFVRQGDSLQFHYDGDVWSLELANSSRPRRKKSRQHSMSAPMPGVVLKIFVAAGDVVPQGAPLIILEAMKMEHRIDAPYAGSVKSVNCKAGELVQPGVDLIDLTPEVTE